MADIPGGDIVKRCVWCPDKHCMDAFGNPILGRADDPKVLYSDGMCREAEERESAKLDQMERADALALVATSLNKLKERRK